VDDTQNVDEVLESSIATAANTLSVAAIEDDRQYTATPESIEAEFDKNFPDPDAPVYECNTDEGSSSCLQTTLIEARQNPVYQRLSAILHWRDVIESGLVFSIGNFFFFLVTYGDYSVLSLLTILAVAFFSVSGAFVAQAGIRARIAGKPFVNPLRERFGHRTPGFSERSVRHAAELVSVFSNHVLASIRNVAFFSCPVHSFVVIFVLYLVSQIGKFFEGLTLLYLLFLIFFIWPRLYAEKHAEIDRLAGKIRDQVAHFYRLALSKVPPNVRQKLKLE